MTPTIHPGTHPDAQVLSAFAEQLLSDTERKDVVAHMAACGRCREVVFLAQQAMEAEEPVQPVAEVPGSKPGGSWFTGWGRWSWIPVAALAGVVGFAVIRHVDRASVGETRMAQNTAPLQPMQSGPATKPAAPQPEPQPARPSREESTQKAAAPERADRDAELDRRSIDEKDKFVVHKKDEVAKESDSLSAAALKDSNRTVHGTLEARAKSSGAGGPMAQNQVQQQNNAQLQQNYANEDRQAIVPSESANKPVSSPIRSGAASETVNVEAAGGPLPVSPTPAAPALAAQTESESVVVSGKTLSKRKEAYPVLPSKLAAMSEATSGRRTIAIDTAGALYLSEDAGEHWQPVNARWSGRPVRVKTSSTVGAVGGLLKQTIARFELTTDKRETWASEDGKAWTLEAPAAK